jgi:hypothetical protein
VLTSGRLCFWHQHSGDLEIIWSRHSLEFHSFLLSAQYTCITQVKGTGEHNPSSPSWNSKQLYNYERIILLARLLLSTLFPIVSHWYDISKFAPIYWLLPYLADMPSRMRNSRIFKDFANWKIKNMWWNLKYLIGWNVRGIPNCRQLQRDFQWNSPSRLVESDSLRTYKISTKLLTSNVLKNTDNYGMKEKIAWGCLGE